MSWRLQHQQHLVRNLLVAGRRRSWHSSTRTSTIIEPFSIRTYSSLPSRHRRVTVFNPRRDYIHNSLDHQLKARRYYAASPESSVMLSSLSTHSSKTTNSTVKFQTTQAIKQRSPNQKSNKESASPQLLQLRNPHPRDTVEQHFEMAALRTELPKFNFMTKLRDKLLPQNHKPQDGPTAATIAPSTTAKTDENSAWRKTEQFFESRQKTIPPHVKNIFWNLILASTTTIPTTITGSSNNNKRLKKKMPSVEVSEKHISILMQAREKAVKVPIFWNHKHKHEQLRLFLEETPCHSSSSTSTTADNPNNTSNNKKKKIQKDALPEYQAERSKFLTRLHYDKDKMKLHKEAKEMAQHLRNHLPPLYYQKLMLTLEDYAVSNNSIEDVVDDGTDTDTTTIIASATTPRKRRPLRKQETMITQLYAKPIHASVYTHSPWIAPTLLDFFYVTTSSISDTMETSGDQGVDTTATTMTAQHILSTDAMIQARQNAWTDAKNEFVQAFQAVQALLVEEHEAQIRQFELGDSGNCKDDINNPIDQDVDDEEDVLATFQEASKVPEGNVPKPEAKVDNLLLQPKKYIAFEAIAVHDISLPNIIMDPQPPHLYKSTIATDVDDLVCDRTSAVTEKGVEPVVPTNRLVFVDNLPIDVRENALLAAYSRCGEIDDIKVFHRREDLDPGRSSDDGKKKIRRPTSASRQSWERPRTPLYATILYRDPAGAQKATLDPLRIFGMVVDQHLIRSYRARDMTSLYVENISPKLDVSAIEYELSQILYPRLYVCLDIERRRQKRPVGPPNSVIQFPDFESAQWAYTRLLEDLSRLSNKDEEVSQTAVHWMPTPRDAMLYWTRQLNF